MKKTMNITTVLFDLDGTLIDSSRDLCSAYNKLLCAYHLPPIPEEQLKKDVAHGINPLFQRDFGAQKGTLKNKMLRSAFTQLYEANLTTETSLFAGIDSVLQFLNQSQTPWGIVTNKIERFTRPIIEHFELLRHTKTLICGDTLAQKKPQAFPIIYACQQLGAIPEKTAFIGDTEIDITAANRAGAKGIAVAYNSPITAENARKWGAAALVHEPRELLHWLMENINHEQKTE
jgi:2-phosphoglycolate phosphatase